MHAEGHSVRTEWKQYRGECADSCAQMRKQKEKHKSWTVRMAAVDSLARRNDPTVIPQLEARLSDDQGFIGYTAAAAIIRLADLQDKSAQLRPSLR